MSFLTDQICFYTIRRLPIVLVTATSRVLITWCFFSKYQAVQKIDTRKTNHKEQSLSNGIQV